VIGFVTTDFLLSDGFEFFFFTDIRPLMPQFAGLGSANSRLLPTPTIIATNSPHSLRQ
jgi:hypothetical protein